MNKKTTMKNPKWKSDELILALDLYFRCPPGKTNKENQEIIALSELLNSLPIHPKKTEYEKFRNPNGVYMKLCNFLRFDPNYSGKGLEAGGKLEEIIWNRYCDDTEKLKKVAQAIKDSASEVSRPIEIEQDEEEFEEGRVLTKIHKIRERSQSLTREKKADVLKESGRLECETCGFDFHKFYGSLGQGVAECHHTKPVSELKKGGKTKKSELSILCSNCHTVIHKSKPMMTVPQLKKHILSLSLSAK